MKQDNLHNALRTVLLTAALAVLATAVSCSKDTAQELGTGAADGAIRITSQIAASQQSRGVSLDNEVLTEVVLLRTDATTATTPSSFEPSTRITASRQTDGKLTDFSSVPYYKTNDDYAHFIAFHPCGSSYSTSGETWTLDGTIDLLLTKTPWCAGRYSAPVTTGMTFEHQLAQLQVICKPDPNAELALVTAAWGQITKIELLETATKATFNNTTCAMTFAISETRELKQTDCNTAFTSVTLAANTTTPCAGGMYAPDASGTAVLKLKVYSSTTLDGKTVEVQLKSDTNDKGFAKGMTHTVTLTFGVVDKNIDVSTSSVDAWVEGGTGDSGTITPLAHVGDYYYSDGTFSQNLLSGKTVEGVIYWVDATNPKHFKIVAMDEPPANWDGGTNAAGQLPWSTESIATGATSTSDGKSNTLKLMKLPTANLYKAAKWCYTKNAGLSVPAAASAVTSDAAYRWYLPAKDELQHLFCAYWGVEPSTWTNNGPAFSAAAGYPAAWNARFTTPFSDSDYWTGTEFNVQRGWSVSFRNGNTDYQYYKSDVSYTNVRCVREVDPPPPTVEDYYYSDGTYSRDLLGSKTVEGVIYWVDATNPKHFKIVAMDQPPANWDGGTNAAGQLPWSTESIETGATSTSDGKSNTLKLMKLPTANLYKAAKWCYTKNAGLSVPAAASAVTSDAAYQWYLPAKDELQHLFCAYWGVGPSTWSIGAPSFSATAGYPAAWNARFTQQFSDSDYWPSVEHNNTDGWRMYFSTGATNYFGYYKTTLRNVRCVREVTH